MKRSEKCRWRVDLYLPESTYREVQRGAMVQQRRLSEWVRLVLEAALESRRQTHGA